MVLMWTWMMGLGCYAPPAGWTLDTQLPVQGIGLLEAEDYDDLALPEGFSQGLTEALAARSVALDLRDGANTLGGLSAGARPEAAWSQDQGSQPWLLLVEARASFGDQLGGRYRWVVDTRVTLSPRSSPETHRVLEQSIPVFLLFPHQQEAAALEEALPGLLRDLDPWLRDQLTAGG